MELTRPRYHWYHRLHTYRGPWTFGVGWSWHGDYRNFHWFVGPWSFYWHWWAIFK